MKQTVIVNIYNFIRMSHVEPSRFIIDDFETIRSQLILVKQLGFPGTYALKYDALMDPAYQALLREYLDENDEISAWWEITEPLCRRAGVRFRDSRDEAKYDDRVDSAYSLGYTPEERKKIADAYMADFHAVFGRYPETIGSWVLDSVTIQYVMERYGLVGACICRDQMGVDGFTLWGGWPNGMYYPSKNNAFIPASTEENQLNVPVFRLLGPDPIYNFEADVRHGLQGVYTLEPSWLTGRDLGFIQWFFSRLTEEDALGIGYAHVGQENNFLWENIRPGFGPQLHHLETLHKEGKLRVETMAQSARWFRAQYRLTPPMSFQASQDWNGDSGLSAQWYASANYRVGFLGEGYRLRIRDLFLFREDYPCRYLHDRMKGTKSTFDALPVLFPQAWGGPEDRPFIRLLDEEGREPRGDLVYDAPDEQTARARLVSNGTLTAEFTMDPAGITLKRGCHLYFDRLPVFRSCENGRITMEHEGFSYSFTVACGEILLAGANGVELAPREGMIRLTFGSHPGDVRNPGEVPFPVMAAGKKRPVPPMAPVAHPADSLFSWGSRQRVTLSCHDAGTIRYTLDGAEPGPEAPVYEGPITISSDTVLKARLFTPAGGRSETITVRYQFGLTDIQLESPTSFDGRPVFKGNGITDLLETKRGTLDYLDGRWRGTLEDLEVTGTLETAEVRSIAIGFLSHHRSGIVYPGSVELYVGPDREHLALKEVIRLPNGPCAREIAKTDVEFGVNERIGAFRLIARRHKRMPQWCCYRGATTVFTMADSLIVKPVHPTPSTPADTKEQL